MNTFTDNSRYRKAHNEIVDFVKNQVSIDLNQFRNGDGTSPYTTSYWDAKKRSCICVDWSKMTRNQRNTLLSLKFITVTICGAWMAMISKKQKNGGKNMKNAKATTATTAEATETTVTAETTTTTVTETTVTKAPTTTATETAPAKYDRKAVMQRAWEIFHTLQGDRNAKLSYALKMAWAEAKQPATVFVKTNLEKVCYKIDTFYTNEYRGAEDIYMQGRLQLSNALIAPDNNHRQTLKNIFDFIADAYGVNTEQFQSEPYSLRYIQEIGRPGKPTYSGEIALFVEGKRRPQIYVVIKRDSEKLRFEVKLKRAFIARKPMTKED